jgi:diguanylate cyclase (GGDEF)-like protein
MLDIGMPAIHSVLRGEYVKLIEKTGGDHDLLPKIEREALGFDHAEAGAQLAERWRLPSEMVIAIRKHHDDDIPPSTGVLGRIVALGYQAAATLCISPAAAALARFRRNAKDWLGLHEGECDELLAEIASDAAELSKLFQINTGAVSDVRAILAQAEEASLEHQLTVAREAESLRRMNIDLAQQAATDPLTGTGNRARFENDLRANLENAQQCGSSLAVLIIDADYFKRVNDEFGHAAGDEVLVEIGKRLTRQAREIGVVCRWGGEEFAIVLKNVDSRIATRVAEAMRTAMADMPVELRSLGTAGASVNVTVSIGVAVLDERTRHILNTPHLLIQAADRALYEAKSAGRNCVRFANEAAARAA